MAKYGYDRPIVLVQRQLDDWNIIEFKEGCPYCGKKHRHGTGGGSFDFSFGHGHRGSHCGGNFDEDNVGYYLKEANDERRQEIEAEWDKLGYKYEKAPKLEAKE